MKSKLNKYMTRGAMVACTAVLFSCDGDDGSAGATGAPGASGASGAVKDLPVAAPKVTQLPLSEIDAIVDETTQTVTWSDGTIINPLDRLNINFLSETFAQIIEGGNDLGDTAIDYVDDGTEFTVSYDEGGDKVNVLFEVLDSEDYTLTGIFTAEGREDVDLDLGQDSGANLTEDGGTLKTGDLASISLAESNGTATKVQQDVDGVNTVTHYVLKTGEILVGVTNPGDDNRLYVINAAGIAKKAADAAGAPSVNEYLLGLNGSDVETDAGTNELVVDRNTIKSGAVGAEWSRVVVLGQLVDAVKGTFRLDMNPSQGGVSDLNNEGLNTLE